MKPDWKEAPDWAEFLVLTPTGDWWWYECNPETGEEGEGLSLWAGRNSDQIN
jgi:hypothetical protein